LCFPGFESPSWSACSTPQGKPETGPYQSPRENGMMHFHAFLRREIKPHLQ
jgi:hypothetical protein